MKAYVRVASILVALALAQGSLAAPLPDDSLPRLERLARLWGEVRFRHPWIVTRGVDWDEPLLEAIPRVLAASTQEEERAALSKMLGALGDPGTYLLAQRPTDGEATPSTFRWSEGEVLVIRLGKPRTFDEVDVLAGLFKPELAKAKAVVLDLRDQPAVVDGIPDAGDVLAALAGGRAPRVTLRSVVHSGYRTQGGQSSGGYSTTLSVEPGEVMEAAKDSLPRIVFLADATSPLTPLVPVLQRAGKATLVAVGGVSDFYFSDTRLDLGPGLIAMVRHVEPDPPLRADLLLTASASGSGDAALQAALEVAKPGRAAVRAAPTTAPADDVAGLAPWAPDRGWPEASPPNLSLRLLALIRMWNVIRFFDPYLALLDEPWGGTLVRHAQEFAAAETQQAYEDAVAALGARLQDTHVRVEGPSTRARFAGRIPATVRFVEGRAVIVRTEPAAAAAGLRVGDVIEDIDGAPLLERAATFRKTTAASTAAGLAFHTIAKALSGPAGSAARLVLSGEGGRRRTVEVRRTRPDDPPAAEPEELPWRWLPGKVGFVDLTRLLPDQVTPMLVTLAGAESIVFDLRGYPRGVFWTLAPHLNIRSATVAAQFRRRLVGRTGGADDDTWYAFGQSVAAAEAPVFRGRSVMLIDERTISQAEHTGLFLEAAAGTVFVGAPSAGANGDVTYLRLPGDVEVRFTGHEVRHADGRQLQRLGLQPTVRVAPTLRGIRSGRDEVLEAALTYLKKGRNRKETAR